MPAYDALIVVSFGGPESRDEVLPFLEKVLRGRNVPRARLLEVAEHYYHFDGISPINEQNRELIEALRAELTGAGIDLPIYFGNRNWHPLLTDTLRQMEEDGVRRGLAYVTSAFSSYSGCRQYRENIADALAELENPPQIDKLRVFYNHPGFVEAMADRVQDALEQIPQERREAAKVLYTAHSIPLSMAAGCRYELQLVESARLIGSAVGKPDGRVVYQSRSGPPTQPWLEPDVCDAIDQLREAGPLEDLVIVPLGFVSDHMEVLFDLDEEAAEHCGNHGINMVRAGTVGVHPRFVTMLRELIEERLHDAQTRPALGEHGPSHDVCPEDCCLRGATGGRPAASR